MQFSIFRLKLLLKKYLYKTVFNYQISKIIKIKRLYELILIFGLN